jgi:hypothetical protein
MAFYYILLRGTLFNEPYMTAGQGGKKSDPHGIPNPALALIPNYHYSRFTPRSTHHCLYTFGVFQKRTLPSIAQPPIELPAIQTVP